MARAIHDFVKTYLVITAIMLVFALLISVFAHLAFVYAAMLVYLWGGLAYILASLLAWTGFSNLYRYSPTLFVGSASYRRQVVRGDLWKEGRDDSSLFIGMAFGLAIVALGAALWDPLFIVVDVLGVVVVGLVVHYWPSRSHAKS